MVSKRVILDYSVMLNTLQRHKEDWFAQIPVDGVPHSEVRFHRKSQFKETPCVWLTQQCVQIQNPAFTPYFLFGLDMPLNLFILH